MSFIAVLSMERKIKVSGLTLRKNRSERWGITVGPEKDEERIRISVLAGQVWRVFHESHDLHSVEKDSDPKTERQVVGLPQALSLFHGQK